MGKSSNPGGNPDCHGPRRLPPDPTGQKQKPSLVWAICHRWPSLLIHSHMRLAVRDLLMRTWE